MYDMSEATAQCCMREKPCLVMLGAVAYAFSMGLGQSTGSDAVSGQKVNASCLHKQRTNRDGSVFAGVPVGR